MSNVLKHALDGTASAVADDPRLAGATFAAEGELVGVSEVDEHCPVLDIFANAVPVRTEMSTSRS